MMEDSGIDSDARHTTNGSAEENHDLNKSGTSIKNGGSASTLKMMNTSSQLQQKIEKQREANRKYQGVVGDQPKRGMLSRTRLLVPNGKPQSRTPTPSAGPDTQPLVMIESDESEDEFALPRLSKQAQREITQQLIKDGYNLDLEPDDEDLDLIPPRPVHERYVCCSTPYACNSSQCCVQ